MKREYKLYITRSYIKARNIKEAIKLSKNKEPDEVRISDEWKENKIPNITYAVGFDVNYQQDAD